MQELVCAVDERPYPGSRSTTRTDPLKSEFWVRNQAVAEPIAGDENPEDAQDEAVLVRFIKHVMDNKVVQLDELGGEFSLRVHEIIARVGALESMGYLSGVTDDRGKFIYVSKDELQAVAKFIGRKGRVRIAALAQESNKLIDLQPRQVAIVDDDEGGEGEGGEAPVGS